jgi:hypothetical protein
MAAVKHFDIGDEVLFYNPAGRRVYGVVHHYPSDDDNLITIEVLDEDDSVVRHVTIDEQFVRNADDPDDPDQFDN